MDYQFFVPQYNAYGNLIVTTPSQCSSPTAKSINVTYSYSWFNNWTNSSVRFSQSLIVNGNNFHFLIFLFKLDLISLGPRTCYTDFSHYVSSSTTQIFNQMIYTIPLRISDYYSFPTTGSYFSIELRDGLSYDPETISFLSGTNINLTASFIGNSIPDISYIGMPRALLTQEFIFQAAILISRK